MLTSPAIVQRWPGICVFLVVSIQVLRLITCLYESSRSGDPAPDALNSPNLIRWEFPRLCRGGSRRSTSPGVGIYGPVNAAIKTPHPVAHGRHPLPSERASNIGRAPRPDSLSFPCGEGCDHWGRPALRFLPSPAGRGWPTEEVG
jgi:hypothetical protein